MTYTGQDIYGIFNMHSFMETNMKFGGIPMSKVSQIGM